MNSKCNTVLQSTYDEEKLIKLSVFSFCQIITTFEWFFKDECIYLKIYRAKIFFNICLRKMVHPLLF